MLGEAIQVTEPRDISSANLVGNRLFILPVHG